MTKGIQILNYVRQFLENAFKHYSNSLIDLIDLIYCKDSKKSQKTLKGDKVKYTRSTR